METKSLILLMFLLQAIINGVNPTPNNQAFKCSKNDNPNFGNIAEWGWFTPPATHPPTPANADELEKALNDLSNQLREKVKGVNNNKYGTGSINYGPGSKTLYAVMQCIRGMAIEECVKCLSDATNEMHKCCSKLRKTGGIVLSNKCSYWYEHFKFFP
ncbi:putative Gnk2-like domain-containing protein [Helianthus debilis subsp. tardiflorus]